MRISDWSSDVCSSDLRHRGNILAREIGEPVVPVACREDRDQRGIDLRVLMPRLRGSRSEEHTSELQSLMRISYAVFCLKKKKQKQSVNKLLHTQNESTITKYYYESQTIK